MNSSQGLYIPANGKTLHGKIPGSKSYANRLLVLAAIKKENVVLENVPESSDVTSMIECLTKIGLNISFLAFGKIQISNSFPECEVLNSKIIDLFPNEGGTTTRFLIALLARGGQTYRLHLHAHFKQRSLSGLLQALQSLGVFVNQTESVITIKGPYQSGSVIVERNETSQFYSALKMATMDLSIELLANENEASSGYVDMTMDCLKKIKRSDSIVIPMDESSRAYLVAWNYLLGETTKGEVSLQPDSKIYDIIKKWEEFLVFDGKMFPDLIPTLMFLASYLTGKKKFINCTYLKGKESDRLQEMQKILNLFNIDFTMEDDNQTLIIEGISQKLQEQLVTYVAPPDHRMIMISALFMRYNAGGFIQNFQHVNKSFPGFFEILNSTFPI